MNRTQVRPNLGLYLLVFIFFLPQFQNCSSSKTNFTRQASTPPILRADGGNGDGLDGKPTFGDWLRSYPGFNCAGEVGSTQALVKIDNTGSTLVRDNCDAVNFPFSLDDPSLSYEFYNPSYFTFSGAIFEKAEGAKPLHVNESLCRVTDASKGVDVVIRTEGNQRQARVTMGNYATREIFYVNYSGVSKLVDSQSTEFRSDDGSLILKIFGAPEDYKNLLGQLTSHINGALKSYQVTCQKMSEKEILKVDVNGLAAYWKFDEVSITDGFLVADSSGHGLNGRVATADGANKSIPGVSGNAMNFDGTDHIDMGVVLDMPTNDFSVSFWIRHGSNPQALNIFNKRYDLGGGGPGWNVMIIDNYLDARMSDGTQVLTSNALTLPVAPVGFHHVVVVYDRANGIMRYYLDGVDTGQRINISYLGNIAYAGNFKIGKSNYPGAFQFVGALDEVSIWNKALNNADVQAIYSNLSLF